MEFSRIVSEIAVLLPFVKPLPKHPLGIGYAQVGQHYGFTYKNVGDCIPFGRNLRFYKGIALGGCLNSCSRQRRCVALVFQRPTPIKGLCTLKGECLHEGCIHKGKLSLMKPRKKG